MPKKNKLYNCPYELNCKCDLIFPCLGCETWSEHYDEFNSNKHTHEVINLLINVKDYVERDTCQNGMSIYNETRDVLEKLQNRS